MIRASAGSLSGPDVEQLTQVVSDELGSVTSPTKNHVRAAITKALSQEK